MTATRGEPGAAPPPVATISDPYLATCRPGFVPRERLVRRLLHATAVPVVLAIAPAGYGKTTVLSEWAERDSREFAWIALRQADDDALRLLTAIALALDEIEPVGRPVFAALARPARGTATAALELFVDSLARRRRPFVLVLDDVHVLGSADAQHVLRTIAEHVPATSQLVLSAREEPHLPIGRMRAHRKVVELRPNELAMTRGEAAVLLSRTGLKLGADAVATLVERTEGWPAALYLAVLALREQPDVGHALARFAGDDRIVADYLHDELLSELSDDRRLFLARTSILETLSGPLCDAVLERSGSSTVLRDAARSNLLLIALDRSEESYRYHGLFGQALRAELRRLEPENEAKLHARASAWHAKRGDVDRAIHHAIAAGDVDEAGALLSTIAARYVFDGRDATVQSWLDQFTPEQIASNPSLALSAATTCFAAGCGEGVEHWVSAAERGGHNTAAAILGTAVARDGIAAMGADAARAYSDGPDDAPWRALCCLLMGVADHLTGARVRARGRLSEGARVGAVAAPGIRALSLAQLALLEVEHGDLEEAGGFAVRARRQIEQTSLAHLPLGALVFAVSALARANLGHVDDARHELRRAMELLERFEEFAPWYEIETRVALARCALKLGDVVAARTLLEEASRLESRTPGAAVLRAWLEDSWTQVDEFVAASVIERTSLTTAELRVLGLLPTHLSFREIADRFNVSANTIKTQAHAVYRKLNASSRSGAVMAAREVGLLDVTRNG